MPRYIVKHERGATLKTVFAIIILLAVLFLLAFSSKMILSAVFLDALFRYSIFGLCIIGAISSIALCIFYISGLYD